MNHMSKRIAVLSIYTAGFFFVLAILLQVAGHNVFIQPCIVAAMICLAIGFRGFDALKAFSYTTWILTAVCLGMFYPQYFKTVGNFELKKLIIPFVQLTMFGMGAHMSLSDFKGVIKMPKGVMIGICCHFLIMPLVGFLLSHLFGFPPEIAGGIVLIGCVSSAMASNVMSYLSGGNLALAVTIGACSTMVSPLLTPLLMNLLAGQFIQVDMAHMMIDIANMIFIPVIAGFIFNLFYFENTNRRDRDFQLAWFALLIVLINVLIAFINGTNLTGYWKLLSGSFFWFYGLPMIIAVLLRKGEVPHAKLDYILSFVAMLGIVINTVIMTASGRDNLLQVGGLLIITCFLHNIFGLGIGYYVSGLFGLPEKDRRTIAFEVGMQNGGVAAGLATQMGKVATIGLAALVFGPLQNVTGSILANWFKNRPTEIKGS
jgi:BASS family bile acid:Na+ symporter